MKKNYLVLTAIICCYCITGMLINSCSPGNGLEAISFVTDPSDESDSVKTIRSFHKQNDLFVLTHQGAYDTQMEWLNNYLITATKEDSNNKKMCSIFYTASTSDLTFHCQNLDNPESGILVGSYAPPGKYRSVALTRMTDISYFPSGFQFEQLNDMQRSFLPFFAFYPADGINEHGLSVTLAGCDQHQVTEKKNRKGVFISYLNRLILDNCKTVDEAIALSRKYYFFDHAGSISSNHLMVGDSLGNSVVIGYNKEGRMDYLLRNTKATNVMTNNDVVGSDTSQLADRCRRYKAISMQLASAKVKDYQDCMNILKAVQNGTLWSVVMDNANKKAYLAARGKFDKLYQFGFE